MSHIKDLVGKNLKNVTNTGDEVIFVAEDGRSFKLYHQQDCCENVYVEDVVGDLSDLTGTPVISADEEFECGHDGDYGDSFTWTFYKFATAKGYVTIRFYGTSNGYYSESVSFGEIL